jgi:hypothetical protein
MTKDVDLNSVLHPRETALVGRENGESILSKLKKAGYDFESLESQHDKIAIIIPDRIVSINKSYFLGLFETAVEIQKHIEAATLNATQGEILDV